MAFSTIGLLIALSILIPNLLIIVFPPINVPAVRKDAGMFFTILERIGQISCLLLLIMSKQNNQYLGIDSWFILMVLCIIFYHALWIRYIIKGHDFSLLFKPLFFLPIPMALFPIFVFVFASLWTKSIYLGIAVILFSIGHLRNSWFTYKLLN